MFAAVSLAIVWGSTLERLKFVVYPLFAIVFAGAIYPLIAHWVFGGGVPAARSAPACRTSPARGRPPGRRHRLARGPADPRPAPRQVRPRRQAPRHPGPLVPLVGLGVLILGLGWFGFNGGSTLGTSGSRFAEVILVTQLGAVSGIIGACR